MTGDGSTVFRMDFASPVNNIDRTIPVVPGEVTRGALRAGMDAQYP